MNEIEYKGHLIVEGDGIYRVNYFCVDGSTICDTFESIEEAKDFIDKTAENETI